MLALHAIKRTCKRGPPSALAVVLLIAAVPSESRPPTTAATPKRSPEVVPGRAVGAGSRWGSPQDTQGVVARAQGLLQQQQFAEAETLLLEFLEQYPDEGRAWLYLGLARQMGGDLEGAIEANRRALEIEASAPRAAYNIGVLHAARDEIDEAYRWLQRARATGQMDTTIVFADPNAAKLRDDSRWATLFPDPEEFDDPFVEDVEVVHEWRGEGVNHQYGWIARNVGDVDEDGVDDAVVSAPFAPQEGQADGPPAGRVYVYSGRTGEELWRATGPPGGTLGLGVEAAGDVDADGVPDVIASAQGVGRAYVYSGRTGRTIFDFEGGAPADNARKVSDAGDVDGDGHDDFLLGSPLWDGVGEDSGRVVLYSGRDAQPLLELEGERAGDNFGSAVAGATDENGVTLVIGAGFAGPERRGRAYVYRDLSGVPAFVIEAGPTGVNLGGMFVSVIGDVDDDGVADAYASDWADATRGSSTGRIYIHSGADGRRLLELVGEALGDGLGIGPADAGDVDGDGHDDIVVGAWQQDAGAPGGGRVYVHSGRDGSLLATYTCKVMGDTFGFDATGMGDVDGDGKIDFLLTSAYSSVNGPRSGRAFIVSGSLVPGSSPSRGNQHFHVQQ